MRRAHPELCTKRVKVRNARREEAGPYLPPSCGANPRDPERQASQRHGRLCFSRAAPSKCVTAVESASAVDNYQDASHSQGWTASHHWRCKYPHGRVIPCDHIRAVELVAKVAGPEPPTAAMDGSQRCGDPDAQSLLRPDVSSRVYGLELGLGLVHWQCRRVVRICMRR
jgi:hypothetical protein